MCRSCRSRVRNQHPDNGKLILGPYLNDWILEWIMPLFLEGHISLEKARRMFGLTERDEIRFYDTFYRLGPFTNQMSLGEVEIRSWLVDDNRPYHEGYVCTRLPADLRVD